MPLVYLDKESICRDNGRAFFNCMQLRVYTIFFLLILCWCCAIIAAPFLTSWGWEEQARVLYQGFSKLCHQIDDRSYHLAGHKLAVCIRCTAIYFSFCSALILLPFIVNIGKLRSPRLAWLFIAFAPMFADAVLNDIGLHASTSLSRLLTGTILGIVLPLYIVPPFLEAVDQLSTRTFNPGGLNARKTQ